MGIPESLLVLAMSILAVVVLATHKSGRGMGSFLLGVSAGLVAIQVFRVHVFTITALVWVLQSRGLFNARGFNRAWRMLIPVALMALTSLLGDMVNSETLVFQLLGLAVTAMVIMSYSTALDRQQMLVGLLAVTTISSVLALLQVVGIVPIKTWHATISTLGRPIGIYPEPDWLGMFSGIGVLLAWRLPLGRWWRIFAVSANTAALVLAFARAAWIGFGVAVVLTAVIGYLIRRRGKQKSAGQGRGGSVLVLALATAGAFVFLPQLVIDLTVRLNRTFQVQQDDISGQARVRQFDALMRLADMAPLYGHGLSASGRVGVWGQIITGESPNNVASNWLLAMWVDGKFLAVPLMLVLIFTAARYCRTISGQALVLVLVSSLFSNATFFPVTWLLLALCLAEVKLDKPSSVRGHDAPRQGGLNFRQSPFQSPGSFAQIGRTRLETP
ncbi:O-antigen ligase family protein [Arthrobacter sp. ISL-85]|uniref:O-antigen ligase family protein n=1 Tax=Arthrobacter sp. ISL-85 TaxID=2819115 RepID=UPI001BEAE846|nr:O-antigen ligase family protein [Arthrobacter sp. ISL-85]MBT2568966.1 O-antigen ligase family protein [Arthrobacter sp. ISL-85]